MTHVPEVLVLRALGLGDLLTGVPALRGLRRALPGRRLVLAGPPGPGEWLASLGVVDEVVPVVGLDDPVPHRAHPPELAVNLHGRGPGSHRVCLGTGAPALLAFACPAADHDHGPEWRDDEHEVDRWLRLVRTLGPVAGPEDLRLPRPGPREGHVVVHPGAASGSRRWPVARWTAVVRHLAASGHRVVATGSGPEAALCAELARAGAENRCGSDDLDSLARVVGTAALLVSGDTGVAHLATALSTPSVTLFGPVAPALWGPRIDPHLHRALWTGDPADPRPGDPHGGSPDARLLQLEVGAVLEAAHALLGRSQPGAGTDVVLDPASSSTGS